MGGARAGDAHQSDLRTARGVLSGVARGCQGGADGHQAPGRPPFAPASREGKLRGPHEAWHSQVIHCWCLKRCCFHTLTLLCALQAACDHWTEGNGQDPALTTTQQPA